MRALLDSLPDTLPRDEILAINSGSNAPATGVPAVTPPPPYPRPPGW
ncbi:hypothetical protein AB0E83_02665 [Streptomyces sp. NPDC035033]